MANEETSEQIGRTDSFSAEDRLKLAIFDRLPFAIWAATRDCKIVFWNGFSTKNYGHSKEEAIGKDFVDLFVDPLEAEDARNDCADIVNEGKVFRNFLATDRAQDGSSKTMLTNCFRVYDQAGGQFVQVEAALEVNDLEASREKLRSLRQFAEHRQAERRALIAAIQLEVISAIGLIHTRKYMPLMALEQELVKAEQEFRREGERSQEVARMLGDRRAALTENISNLEQWRRDLLKAAYEARTIEKLNEVRAELDKNQ